MKIVSYNVLAEIYVNPGWYPHVKPEFLEPKKRRERMIHFLRHLEADVICLQEVERSLFEELQLPGIWSKKRRSKEDGCATISFLPVIHGETLYYKDQHKGQPSGHLAQLSLIEFEGQKIALSNTHIKWDQPGTPSQKQVGRQQIKELLAVTKAQKAEGFVLCGDFNITPSHPMIELIKHEGFTIASALQPTCNVNQIPQTLDYIFVSKQLVAETEPLPFIEPTTPLPNEEQPSDHLPVNATLRWRFFSKAELAGDKRSK
ncbi:MAG: endonuclease/exonuclease/phosphatase family protein [Verrucomicrobia bacterium]|nr:endonuclease/exonuclease/phosphatase family protein [Verrucomicrobiota bacterium]